MQMFEVLKEQQQKFGWMGAQELVLSNIGQLKLFTMIY